MCDSQRHYSHRGRINSQAHPSNKMMLRRVKIKTLAQPLPWQNEIAEKKKKSFQPRHNQQHAMSEASTRTTRVVNTMFPQKHTMPSWQSRHITWPARDRRCPTQHHHSTVQRKHACDTQHHCANVATMCSSGHKCAMRMVWSRNMPNDVHGRAHFQKHDVFVCVRLVFTLFVG